MINKTKKEHFQNINLSDITNNKNFWITASLVFDNKLRANHKTQLIEENVLAASDEKITKIHCIKKCPYSDFFWSVFSRIRTEYGEIRSISPYSVRMREHMGKKNSEYGHFLRSYV